MKIVLAVDAVIPPLTGIGRYTWELARHYQHSPALSSIRYFFAGRWIERADQLLLATPPWQKQRLPAWLRNVQTRYKLQGHLFHGPNYFLPSQVDRGIVTIHDLSVFKYPETHPQERIRDFENRFTATLSKAIHLITDSEATRQELASYLGWADNRISAVGLGVCPEFYPRPHADIQAPLASLGLSAGRYMLCVSTLEPRKRIGHLLSAYRSLPSALRQRMPLVLAGSKGWRNEDLLKQIEQGQQEGWLHYLGFVPETTLVALYAGAHGFLFPSIYEGYGLPVLEAMACGVPVLTSNRSSLPEVAAGAALLVEPDDIDALALGIGKMIEDEPWRKQARERGLQVAAHRSWESCAEQTLAVYRQFA